MSVGLLLITHNQLGSALLETATGMLGVCPLRAETLSVTEDTERDQLQYEAQQMAERLDTGEGVLVLTDLFGSTPANVANRLQDRAGVRVLTGVNLPMLVRVLNYPGLPLAEMAAKALSGGKDGVLLCPLPDSQAE
ncbi:MAG: PTS fructose transporter subunit IIA [Pseudomonadota bacterium]|nr:PTS fructose transporter subunit IIA [Pseudomonadota bacterium]